MEGALLTAQLPTDVAQKIRHCVNTGLVLGSESFREQVNLLNCWAKHWLD
jgi:hypothetical protein